MPIHHFNDELISTYHVPGTILGPGNAAVNNMDKIPPFMEDNI